MNRRPRLVAGLLLVLVFFVGGLAGMAVEEGLGLDWFDFLDEDEDALDQSLLEGLDLTAEQRGRIEEILDAREDSLEAYWGSRIPDLRRIVSASDDRVREVLTPEQRERFDARRESGGARIPDGPD